MPDVPVTLDSDVEALLLAKFGTSWQVIGNQVFGSVGTFNGTAFVPNATTVYLGNLDSSDLKTTIENFGRY